MEQIPYLRVYGIAALQIIYEESTEPKQVYGGS
jgi:hypothetical protein